MEPSPEPGALDSAHRHSVSNAAVLHALRSPVRHVVQDGAMTIHIGPDETGTLVEVGEAIGTSGEAARPRYSASA